MSAYAKASALSTGGARSSGSDHSTATRGPAAAPPGVGLSNHQASRTPVTPTAESSPPRPSTRSPIASTGAQPHRPRMLNVCAQAPSATRVVDTRPRAGATARRDRSVASSLEFPTPHCVPTATTGGVELPDQPGARRPGRDRRGSGSGLAAPSARMHTESAGASQDPHSGAGHRSDMTQMPTAPPQYPTSQYPTSLGPTPPPPVQPGHHAPAGPPQRPRRTAFAAGVLAAALVVGGGAGVGGAALYLDAQDSPTSAPQSGTEQPDRVERPRPRRRRLGRVGGRRGAAVRRPDRGRPAPQGSGHRVGHHPQRGRPDPDQQPRRRGAPGTAARSGSPSRTAPRRRPRSSAPTRSPTPRSSRPRTCPA